MYRVLGDRCVFDLCRRLYCILADRFGVSGVIELVRSGSYFRCSGFSVDYDFINSLFRDVCVDVRYIRVIVLDSYSLGYDGDMAYLYEGGCSIRDGVLMSYTCKYEGYPFIGDVVVPVGGGSWFSCPPCSSLIRVISSISDVVIGSSVPSIIRVHIVGGLLCISSYFVCGSCSSVYSYGGYELLDRLLGELVSACREYSFGVKELYWYVGGSYSRVDARMCSDGECVLVVS